MSKKMAAGTALMYLILSGITLYFGGLTLDKLDSNQWGLAVLGAGVTALVFFIMVVIVKGISKKGGDDK